jgi:probable addiction module antidote protein
MRKYRSYNEYLIASLKDPEEASAYLKACLEEALETNELGIFQLAVRNVVEAQGGITKISSEMDVGRESFYKSLSKNGKPRFSTIIQALKACGLEIDFHPVHV